MTYEAHQQIGKAIRSLPWYMFLVPALFTLLVALLDIGVLISDNDPKFGYWAMMWMIAKLGFFVWVLRQLLRYAMFGWITKLKKAVDYSRETSTVSTASHRVGATKVTSTGVTIISRREIPRNERQVGRVHA